MFLSRSGWTSILRCDSTFCPRLTGLVKPLSNPRWSNATLGAPQMIPSRWVSPVPAFPSSRKRRSWADGKEPRPGFLLKRLLNMDFPSRREGRAVRFAFHFLENHEILINCALMLFIVFQHSLQVGGVHKFSPTALRPSSKTSCGLIWK